MRCQEARKDRMIQECFFEYSPKRIRSDHKGSVCSPRGPTKRNGHSPEEPIRSEDYYKPLSSSGMAQPG